MPDQRHHLLVEIGTEELPPTALLGLSESFARGLESELKARAVEHGELESFAAPRRLALLIHSVAARQSDRETVRRGPALAAAFGPDGSPSKAAEGFARSCGVAVSGLERERTDKGEWLCHRSRVEGGATAALIPAAVESALATLPIPKRMRWGSGEAEFVRPIHWVCLLHGTERIAGRVLGVEAGRSTRGHRFHHPGPIDLDRAEDYPVALRELGRVEPSFARRRAIIVGQVEDLARAQGVLPVVEPGLLDEVTALVEWPIALLGTFDPGFLGVPPEVLIETMQKNQKYFPVRRPDGALDARFVTVCNLESRDPDQVRAGNERVIRPRFADAKFFWEQDLAHPLEERFARLEGVVFQERLGSLADKSRRVSRLAAGLAPRVGVPAGLGERAARLAKCDLVSAMVYEFPGLQGTMGRYYAAHSGEDPCVCAAMDEQYLPRFAGDRLPESGCGRLLGIADRLDTLVGIFGIGQRPSGTKDPYGLRRASIALLRILIETPLDIDLRAALLEAERGFAEGALEPGTAATVFAYCLDRLTGYYQDRGIAADSVEAAVATGESTPSLIDRRIRALGAFRILPAAESLAAATKRIRNILAKSEGSPPSGAVDPSRFVDPAESALWERLRAVQAEVEPMLALRDYSAVLGKLAGLKGDVDRFFDEVMVMAEDPAVRQNRLALLAGLMQTFGNVADISRLQ
jgi:glycyl-tRNA synthetase beta chain